MSDILKDVVVRFEKAFKGDDVRVAKSGEKGGRVWKLYEFNASFKDETGQTKKHKMKSFTVPGPVGTTMTGSIELYHGDGPKGPYTSYTFTPNEGEQPKAAPKPKEQPVPESSSDAPLAVQKNAIRRYVKFVFDTCLLATTDKQDNLNYQAAAEIFPGVRMIVGDFTKIFEGIQAEAANEYAEECGMPADEDIKAGENPPSTPSDTKRRQEEDDYAPSDDIPF